MPIVLVCNKFFDIVWVGGGLCKVIDCAKHPAIGTSLFEFLSLNQYDPFCAKLRELQPNSPPLGCNGRFCDPHDREFDLEFFIESIPEFNGVQNAHLIAIGSQSQQVNLLQTPDFQHQDELKHSSSKPHPALRAATDPLRAMYQFTNLKVTKGQRLFERLNSLLNKDQLFVDAHFNIERASDLLNSNSLYISQVTNFFAKKSFPIFLNQKRLEHLKVALLAQPDESFTSLYPRSGFGSYSSLNRTIKATYGIRPSQYLKKLREGKLTPLGDPLGADRLDGQFLALSNTRAKVRARAQLDCKAKQTTRAN